MPNAAVKSTVYCLNHTPELGFYYGTTPYLERHDKPDSPFLASLPKLVQPYEDAARYAPNLAYIGAMTIEQLEASPRRGMPTSRARPPALASTARSCPRMNSSA